ncbi:hypothetical protein [Halomonas organivorans]|uniref:Uncharacterized protein n=1 Tax=Halomonas organivorans TaxID=257772 RepID=A0A7W5BZU3_9GAMM|nr:hypothetical protein [Halomonas organivorans]MBB3142182.1 hypothetical protein [Halomonas organivorans]
MRLTGVLYNAGGPLASVTIQFEATHTTINGVLVGSDAYFTTQVDGTYSIDLEPGYYNVYWLENGRRVRLGALVADANSSMSLPAAIEAEYAPVQPGQIQDALDQMLAYLGEAQTAQEAAEASATSEVIYTEAAAEEETYTLDASAGDGVFDLTLSAPSVALTIPTPAIDNGRARVVTLLLRQGTGANQVTWPANIHWVGNRAPVLTYDAGSLDSVTLMAHLVDGAPAWLGYYNGGWHHV